MDPYCPNCAMNPDAAMTDRAHKHCDAVQDDWCWMLGTAQDHIPEGGWPCRECGSSPCVPLDHHPTEESAR